MNLTVRPSSASVQERIDCFLRPQSIAIVGATDDTSKIVGGLLQALITRGFKGKIYPVNPNRKEVSGLTCYPSVSAIPGDVEHCVIAVPQPHVAGVVAQCRVKGVRGATVLSAGYAELGDEGVKAQTELKDLAGDMPFIGPNCIGFANFVDNIIATSSAAMRQQTGAGDVAVISQSGGLATSSFAFFGHQSGFRFSYMITTGNSAGISYGDLVEYLFEDAATKVIAAIVEDESMLGKIIAAVRRKGLVKPIVLLKCGRGETGTRMAQSHTGALAGDYALARDCAQQFGIVCADDIEDAVAQISLLRAGVTAAAASGLSATSHSGGNLTLFADAADDHNLRFASLSETTKNRIAEVLPTFISAQNPVDVTTAVLRDFPGYGKILEALVDDPDVKAVVVIITVVLDNKPFRDLVTELKQRRPDSRVIVLWNGGTYKPSDDAAIMRDCGIPVFHSARTLMRALQRISQARPYEAASVPQVKLPPLPTAKRLTESESLRFLQDAGISTSNPSAGTREDAASLAKQVGYPIVIKSDVAETHLSDQGGVILNIRSPEELKEATARIKAMPGERIVVSRFLPGQELIASTFHHPAFGPVLMVGSGGLFVELMKDVKFCALPATRSQVANCLGATLVGHALKANFRGAEGFEPAVDLLERLAAVALAAKDKVSQIELNPITVGKHGATAVDAAVVPMGTPVH